MFGKQEFTGTLAAVGTKAEMLKLECSYLNGEFNPMDEQPPLQKKAKTVEKERETSTTESRKNSQSKKGVMMYIHVHVCTNLHVHCSTIA